MVKVPYELDLIIKELQGNISLEERAHLQEWLKKDAANREVYDEVMNPGKLRQNLTLRYYIESYEDELLQQILHKFNQDDGCLCNCFW